MLGELYIGIRLLHLGVLVLEEEFVIFAGLRCHLLEDEVLCEVVEVVNRLPKRKEGVDILVRGQVVIFMEHKDADDRHSEEVDKKNDRRAAPQSN